jgi:hypothetical protein
MRFTATVLSLLFLAGSALAKSERTADAARQRVDHHLQEVDKLARHFETVMSQDCPRFDSRTQWNAYLDGEVEQVVLLLAHIEQAWLEAKQTGDDDVRRHAKGPRKRLDDARALVGKLQSCAGDNGASFSQMGLWRRIEREVPERQAQIALPQ